MQKRRSIVILALCLILCISLCSINVLASPSNEPYITRVQVGNGNIIEIQNGLYEYQAVVPDSSVITSFSVTKNDGIDLTGIFMNGYTGTTNNPTTRHTQINNFNLLTAPTTRGFNANICPALKNLQLGNEAYLKLVVGEKDSENPQTYLFRVIRSVSITNLSAVQLHASSVYEVTPDTEAESLNIIKLENNQYVIYAPTGADGSSTQLSKIIDLTITVKTPNMTEIQVGNETWTNGVAHTLDLSQYEEVDGITTVPVKAMYTGTGTAEDTEYTLLFLSADCKPIIDSFGYEYVINPTDGTRELFGGVPYTHRK